MAGNVNWDDCPIGSGVSATVEEIRNNVIEIKSDVKSQNGSVSELKLDMQNKADRDELNRLSNKVSGMKPPIAGNILLIGTFLITLLMLVLSIYKQFNP